MKPALLIVDDDDEIRGQLKWALADQYEITLAEDRPSALDVFRRDRPAVVLLDLGLPPCTGDTSEGMAALAEMLALDSLTKVIIVTGQSEKETALLAIGQFAYDFLSKPVQLEELTVILKRAFRVAQLERECRQLRSQPGRQEEAFEGMLGASPKIREVFGSIRKVAASNAPVLLLGESGTGKEMVALAVHRRSARKDGPFVAINCAAIPETLLESELFGHEKGSFTGAHAQRAGRIEMAEGGTLFLDEIGELPLQVQVKLLRFLQEQTIERVGGRKTIQVDTRVVAATNSDLKQGIAAGKFREDLYFRLAVVVLRIPPLRERVGDITTLARAFLQKFGQENGRKGCEFARSALAALEQHPWPGNVRELENRVKRAVIMAEGRQIMAADLELEESGGGATKRTLKEARDEVERQMVVAALERHKGKIAPAAIELGISRPTFYELMEKHHVQKPEKPGEKE